jgi:lipoprotein signal peptidase
MGAGVAGALAYLHGWLSVVCHGAAYSMASQAAGWLLGVMVCAAVVGLIALIGERS